MNGVTQMIGAATGPFAAPVSRSTSGFGTPIVEGVEAKRIRVVGYVLAPTSPVSVFWRPSNQLDVPVQPGETLARPSYYRVGDLKLLGGVGTDLPDLPWGAGLHLHLDTPVLVTGAVLYRFVG